MSAPKRNTMIPQGVGHFLPILVVMQIKVAFFA